jgi:hypothetical protein
MGSLPRGAVALVTGAARRLGRAIALRLAAGGCGVVIHYRSSEQEAQQVARLVASEGVGAWLLQADLADPGEAEALAGRAMELAGRLDVLVNNASSYPGGDLATLGLDDLVASLRLNAWAPFAIARGFACSARQGRIVNMLDARLRGYDREHAQYILAKHMLERLTRMLAMEFAPGFTVNAVAPGLVMAPVDNEGLDIQRLTGDLPLRRAGSPEDVVEAVEFLLGSGYITGQVIYVDGGRHLREP